MVGPGGLGPRSGQPGNYGPKAGGARGYQQQEIEEALELDRILEEERRQ